MLGDLLYVSPKNSAEVDMPSPNALKNKVLLRGKKLGGSSNEDDEDENEANAKKKVSCHCVGLTG